MKGDQILEDGKRIVLFSSNDHLDHLARAKQVLGDGTFKITPKLWYQTFIIQAQVSSQVFVPVAFCLLPDKKRQSYDTMFSLLKEALECRGLQLSAEYFMSDFEIAIRDSFVNHFPGIKAKGCAFHFAKAIISKVKSNGFKSDFSNTKLTTAEGYNARLNSSSYLSDHPNVFLFAKSIIKELKTSTNNAVMAQAGNANTRGPNTKKMRSAGIRKKLQLQLEEGTIDLISFQQAVGGCILTQEVTKEMNCDDLPFDISGRGREDVAIRVPELCEIVAPVPDTLALELETVESLSSRTPALKVYRHRCWGKPLEKEEKSCCGTFRSRVQCYGRHCSQP